MCVWASAGVQKQAGVCVRKRGQRGGWGQHVGSILARGERTRVVKGRKGYWSLAKAAWPGPHGMYAWHQKLGKQRANRDAGAAGGAAVGRPAASPHLLCQRQGVSRARGLCLQPHCLLHLRVGYAVDGRGEGLKRMVPCRQAAREESEGGRRGVTPRQGAVTCSGLGQAGSWGVEAAVP